jgi:cobalt-zinc-cadmium efflux system protein
MTRETRLTLVLAVNLAMVTGLVLVGLLAHSLGVLAAGADYLGDALGSGLSLVALRMSRRGGASSRATSFAALFNAGLLTFVTLAVAVDAVHRLSAGAPAVDGVPVVAVSLIAAGAMVACALVLGDVAGDLNMQSVMLDTVADAAAAAGVAASGTVILLSGSNYWLDPAVALVIAVLVGYHAIRLIRRVLVDLRRRQAIGWATADGASAPHPSSKGDR